MRKTFLLITKCRNCRIQSLVRSSKNGIQSLPSFALLQGLPALTILFYLLHKLKICPPDAFQTVCHLSKVTTLEKVVPLQKVI